MDFELLHRHRQIRPFAAGAEVQAKNEGLGKEKGMAFVTAFLWGTGISLGFCAGLVVWSLIRPFLTSDEWRKQHDHNSRSIEALEQRNRLTVDLHRQLARIADSLSVWTARHDKKPENEVERLQEIEKAAAVVVGYVHDEPDCVQSFSLESRIQSLRKAMEAN